MAKLVSTTYGDALFDLALEENKVDELYEEIQALDRSFQENEELLKLLNHPEVIKEEKLSVIDNVFKGRVSDESVGFLRIIVEKDRYNDIPAIFAHFLHCVKEYKGIGSASVTSAAELTDDQKKRLTERLLATTRYNTFETNYTVDPGLLGGMIIRIEDRVMDSSLKSQLDRLTRQLSDMKV